MIQIYWHPGTKLQDVTLQCVRAAFEHFRENKTQTAAALGISIRTLDTRLSELRDKEEKEKKRQELSLSRAQASIDWHRGMTPAGAKFDSSATPSPHNPNPREPITKPT